MSARRRSPEPRSRRVDVLGVQVHVREAGEGAPVLLLHGLGVSGRYFTPLAKRLARGRRTVVPDLPGSGASGRASRPPDVEAGAVFVAELLVREAGERAAVVANSYGCQVALALAERFPRLVGPLVLIGPTVDPGFRTYPEHATRLALAWWREPPALWRIVVRDYARMGLRPALATAREALADRPEERLPHVESPVLVMRGDRDAIATEGWARTCASLASDGAFAAVPGAAHAAHFSHPVEVGRLVEGFLAERDDRVRELGR